jgi:hypothetical protein
MRLYQPNSFFCNNIGCVFAMQIIGHTKIPSHVQAVRWVFDCCVVLEMKEKICNVKLFCRQIYVRNSPDDQSSSQCGSQILCEVVCTLVCSAQDAICQQYGWNI